LETFDLLAHPAHPPAGIRRVTARVLSWDANWCVLRWWQATCFELFVAPLAPVAAQHANPAPPEPVEGCAQTPARQSPDAAIARVLRQAQDERGGDKKPDAATYSEFNFSPSERWAAYDFTAYREGIAARTMDRAPVITPRRGGDVLFCDVAIPSAQLPPLPWRYALTAVIVEAGGTKSFWAPAHGGERPDFHDPACLAGVLAAPVGA
jgi:hypothetical protein